MCCVTVEFSSYLMPADKGMKLVELLQHAYACRVDFGDRDYTFQPEPQQPRVEFKLVRANQVLPPAAPDKPKVLRLTQ